MTQEELFDFMVQEDGRLEDAFYKWKEGTMSAAAFSALEKLIVEEIAVKVHQIMCRKCNPLNS